ncbi:MAG: TldD/PmbA family protein, partial [Dehalococcoidia bacterium]|nr:TldD/PmbA family protein [Dehalococcoidia bacterium]
MLSEKQGRELVQRVLSLSKAEQTEVSIYADDSSLTRFANNEIHQNVAERDTVVVIKAIMGRRFGLGTTNDLSETGLQTSIDKAIAAAKILPDLEEFLPAPGPQELPEAGGFSIATAEFGPLQRAAGVRVICERAKENGLIAAGAFRIDLASRTVGNSQGLIAHHQTTTADFMTVIMSPTSSGYSAQLSVDVADINAEALAAEALWKANRGKDPQAIQPGEYEVVLESYAVGDMLDFL